MIPLVQQRSIQDLIDKNLMEHRRGIDEMMARFRNTIIVRALAITGGNITKTAELLRTTRTTLVRWMDEFNLRGTD